MDTNQSKLVPTNELDEETGLPVMVLNHPPRTGVVYLVNAFSLNMLGALPSMGINVRVTPLTPEGAKNHWIQNLHHESAVGHPDTANLLSGILGISVPCNRVTLDLKVEDKLVVGQYIGPRLPEGTTTLPEGSRIDFYLVEFSVR